VEEERSEQFSTIADLLPVKVQAELAVVSERRLVVGKDPLRLAEHPRVTTADCRVPFASALPALFI
jgi:hypothetical protein